MRIIYRAKFMDNNYPLFANVEVLPLEDLITYYRLKCMHCYYRYYNKLPISFAELWLTNSERNPERMLKNANDCYIRQNRIELVAFFGICSCGDLLNGAPGWETGLSALS